MVQYTIIEINLFNIFTDFSCFVSAVIDKASYTNIKNYVDFAKNNPTGAEIVYGGDFDDSKGYFVTPTLIQALDPKFKTMEEEIFGPVLTVYVYPDAKYEETLRLCDSTSPYALTGAIFARDREAIVLASKLLRNSSGNFCIKNLLFIFDHFFDSVKTLTTSALELLLDNNPSEVPECQEPTIRLDLPLTF